MNGQGSPHRQSLRRLGYALFLLIHSWVILLGPFCAHQEALAESGSVRVRFEWGGTDPAIWVGSIQIPDGLFADFRVLGLDADQPGAFVNEGEQIRISPRFATQRSGFEALVTGDLDEAIRIRLTPESDPDVHESFNVTLREILQQAELRKDLSQGHVLVMRRSPGDQIRIRFPRDHMVFAPGERIPIDLRVAHVDVKPGASLRAKFRLRATSEAEDSRVDVTEFFDDGLWSRTETLRVDENGKIDSLLGIEVPIPNREGSFELSVELTYRLPLVGNVAKRLVEFVVVDPQRPPLFGSGHASLVTEFDPADPRWRDYFAQLQNRSNLIPGRKRGPWNNVPPTVEQRDGKPWTKISENGWVGYSLSGIKPGIPHILELEFPRGTEQQLGVAIVDFKSDGAWECVHGDAGISLGDADLRLAEVASGKNLRHRIVFWPKSTLPAVVISNRSQKSAAFFGKIRVAAYPQGLPVSRRHNGSRKRMAVVRGELLKSIFFASHIDQPNNDTDSWDTFFTAANRFVAYLRYAGYDGAAINIAGDGSTLFPSSRLHPTAKFDDGIFAADRRDPFQKDVLELLFQLFDREGLILIPGVEFTTPLPELEATLASEKANAEGIELLDFNRRPASGSSATDDGLAAYYNPLNLRVQNAMGRAIQDILRRYDHHSSFGGIQLNCRAEGFSQLPGVPWAMDRATLNAFYAASPDVRERWSFQDVQKKLTSSDRSDPNASDLVQSWILWRAHSLTSFYQKLAALLSRSDRRLFMSVVDLMDSQLWQRELRPALPRKSNAQNVLLEMGLDIPTLQGTENLIVMRPNRVVSLHHLGSQAVNLEATELDIQQSFRTSGPSAVQFEYESNLVENDRFDRLGPTRKVNHLFLKTLQRAGSDARKHLAWALAQNDDSWVFEGGNMLPFGQEHEQTSFYRVFRELPSRKFERVELKNAGPVEAWVSVDDSTTVAYFVNVSPWEAKVGIQWKAPQQVDVKILSQPDAKVPVKDLLDRYDYDVAIEPYGLLALKFESPQVTLVGCQTELPSGVAQELRAQLEEVVSREKQIQNPEAASLVPNAGFNDLAPNGQIQNWFPSTSGGSLIGAETRLKAEGRAALRMFSPSEKATARIVSDDFLAPESGRMVVFLKLRKVNPNSQPPLVLRVESSDDDYQPFHYFELISAEGFADHALRFVDLPAEPELRLRLSLELLGPGEVWIDDIRIYDRWIFEDEKKDLKKIIQRAATQVRVGDFANCYQTLSGYWPRFLLRHVPPPRIASRPQPVAVPDRSESEERRFFQLPRFMRLRK